MFASKVDGAGNLTGVGDVGSERHITNSYGSLAPPGPATRERKISAGSGSQAGGGPGSVTGAPASGGGMKSKWMKAFKGVKKESSEDRWISPSKCTFAFQTNTFSRWILQKDFYLTKFFAMFSTNQQSCCKFAHDYLFSHHIFCTLLTATRNLNYMGLFNPSWGN